MSSGECLGRDQQRVRTLLEEVGEGRFQLLLVSRSNRMQEDMRLVSRDLRFTHALRHPRIRRIPQNCKPRNSRIQPAKHVESLRAQIRSHEGVAGDVPPWSREARDQTNADWIAVGTKNDRDRTGRLLGGKSCRRPDRHNDVDPLSHQVHGQLRQPINISVGSSAFHDKIRPFDVTELVELAYESCKEKRAFTTRPRLEQPDLEALLCARNEGPRHCACDEDEDLATFHAGPELSMAS
jgi:hypothetical protein